MKTLAIVSILFLLRCSGIADEFPEIFTTEGKHSAVDTRLVIEAVFNGDAPKCSVSARSASGSTTLGFPGLVSVSDGWFFYVESEDRVWLFDGSAKLFLWQFAYKHAGVYDLRGAPWLKSQVPSRLAKMVPKETREEIFD